MDATFSLILLALFLWGLCSQRVAKAELTAPVVFVLLGLLMHEGISTVDLEPSPEAVKALAEITLTWVLFTDAARLSIPSVRADLRLYLRLLTVGLPLCIGLGTLLACALLPHVSGWVALYVAAALAPTDAALGASVMSNPSVPGRIRRAINVESGLNDGIATPFVVLALAGIAAAETGRNHQGASGALVELLIGLAYGGALASVENGVVLYVHGGGFEYRMPELMNLTAHRVSRVTDRPVLVVHYRLAPADPYPAPLDDVVAVYRSLLDQGVPAAKITVFCESSGATLALSALLVLKESGTALPAAVIANSPVTDLTLASPSIDNNSAHDSGVDRAMFTHLVGQYLGGARPDRAPQSPMHGALDGLPPLLFTVGAAEALLDDTLRFAEAASGPGVKVCVDVYEAMPHVFQVLIISDENPAGRRLLARFAEWVAAA
ncbi:alpha/beta hydrolase fold domain-containing protein [Streptomyces sp. NPDC051320]|uniref:alpha/beta hydrolase fold domain-containing protein n=1 Tax=Streptomyces sp. NPDC051320 TaxID=3154644 RepID=UPI003431D48D